MRKSPSELHQRIIVFLMMNLFLSSYIVYAQGDAKTGVTPLQPVNTTMFTTSVDEMVVSPAYDPDELTCCQQSLGCYGMDSDDSSFRLFRSGSRLHFNGWVESGLYTNAHGATSKYAPGGGGLMENSGNGPNFGRGLRTTDFNMNQIWSRLSREMQCENGLDWGFRADLLYGMSGYGVQSEDSFDHGWGSGDYGLGFHQLYGELGYHKLTARYGKFGTPIGWEETASWENFFYSHSYCFNIEPCTHTGAMLYYQLTDGLKLAGGWTAGMESGFANRYRDSSLLAGLELALTQKSMLYYYINQGTLRNGLDEDGFDRFASGLDSNYYIQSVCFEWRPTDKWTYVCQYNLNNTNEFGGDRVSAYGINNHLLYAINERWGMGFRAEWLRDNGVLAYEDIQGSSKHSDYVLLTLGLNFNPTENLRIRPEIRYDHAFKNAIYAYGTKNEQLSGGFALLYGF